MKKAIFQTNSFDIFKQKYLQDIKNQMKKTIRMQSSKLRAFTPLKGIKIFQRCELNTIQSTHMRTLQTGKSHNHTQTTQHNP